MLEVHLGCLVEDDTSLGRRGRGRKGGRRGGEEGREEKSEDECVMTVASCALQRALMSIILPQAAAHSLRKIWQS